ncbi:uncharacterized protein LOC135485998 [Lineus longissimus]|uniref:uncharacterized protein LOC135485998 n=1 Tax=Lineus longissimus TaxID=88925 RepID=UPI002B4D42CD
MADEFSKFWKFDKIFANVALFSALILITIAPGIDSALKDLPPQVLLRHIKSSRHLPICVLFRGDEKEKETTLEQKLTKFWGKRNNTDSYHSWQIGSFNSKKFVLPQIPSSLPIVRCYLGYASPFDYTGKPLLKSFQRWFGKLMKVYGNQLKEASVSLFEQKLSTNKLTLVGFPGPDQHYEVEEIFYEVRNQWENDIEVLLVHPHSPEVKDLMKLFILRHQPAVIFVKGKDEGGFTIVKKLLQHDVSKLKMNMIVAANLVQAEHFNQVTFDEKVTNPYRKYVPVLIYMYTFWTPHAVSYLTMYQRAVAHLKNTGIQLRFGVIDAYEEQNILNKYFDDTYAAELPLLILYYPIRMAHNKNIVKELKKVIVSGKRPSSTTVSEMLKSSGLNFTNIAGKDFVFEEEECQVSLEVSALYEGPHGTMCSVTSHNETENYPAPPVIWRLPPKKIRKKTEKKWDDWHTLHGTEKLEKKLRKLDGIPVVTDATWKEVIEQSHAPFHPFVSNSKWAGEVTKTNLVVFIMADCGSCRRNMDTFKRLHQSVSFITGGSMYIMNCTRDQIFCEQNGVTGFPTIQAFRGLGWLTGERCVSTKAAAEPQYVRLDYHGVIQVSNIMEWFSTVASPAVSNVGFKDHSLDKADVQLLATLTPKASNLLPYIPKSKLGTEFFYPYECFRLACERLFGRVSCKSRYSLDISMTEFEDEDQDMVVTEVVMERADGVSAKVTELMKPLMKTMQDEVDSAIHQFHKPHRYNLNPVQRCEDDHAFCTDVITEFSLDHGRLAVQHMNEAYFHMGKGNLLVPEELPALVALVHTANVTQEASLMKTLTDVALSFYNDISIVTLDVDQYPSWVGQFVPKDFRKIASYQTDIPELYHYPRLCIIRWDDHHHAAFYPSINITSMQPESLPYDYTQEEIIHFIRQFLKKPDESMIETETF